jgi:hypothetical protein
MADNLNTIEQQPLGNTDTNIIFFLEDDVTNTPDNEFNINNFMQGIIDFQDINIEYDEDLKLPQIIEYNENHTVKEVLQICEYYGIAKELKANKCSKHVIVHFLVDFESKPINTEIVFKRQNLWFYMNELKNDKFMKKYVLW